MLTQVYHSSHLRPLFASLEQHLSIAAVLDGTMPGVVFVDDVEHPTAALLACAEGYYATCQTPSSVLAHAVRATLRQIAHDDKEIPIYLAAHWENSLDTFFADSSFYNVGRRHYLCTALRGDWHLHPPKDMRLQCLDASFFAQESRTNQGHVNRWATHNWGSIEHFVARGIGYALVKGDHLVSWCLADCTSGTHYEIGIHTNPDYRRQGYATIVVAATAAQAFEFGITHVGWHCSEDNLGSQGVAEKVGFVLAHQFRVYVWQLAIM